MIVVVVFFFVGGRVKIDFQCHRKLSTHFFRHYKYILFIRVYERFPSSLLRFWPIHCTRFTLTLRVVTYRVSCILPVDCQLIVAFIQLSVRFLFALRVTSLFLRSLIPEPFQRFSPKENGFFVIGRIGPSSQSRFYFRFD